MAVASITGVSTYDRREFQYKQIIVYLGDLENRESQYEVKTGYTTNDALTVEEYTTRQAELIALKSRLAFAASSLFRGNAYFELKTVKNELIYMMFYEGQPLTLHPEVKAMFEEAQKREIKGACIVSTNMLLRYPEYYVSGLLREYPIGDLVPYENESGVYLFTREDIPITTTLISDLTKEIIEYIDGCAEMGVFPLSTPDHIIREKNLTRQVNKYVSDYGRIALKDSTVTVHVNLSSLYSILELIPDLAVVSNRGMQEFVVTGDFMDPAQYVRASKILTAEYPEVDIKYTAYRYERDVKEKVRFLDVRTNYWLGLTR